MDGTSTTPDTRGRTSPGSELMAHSIPAFPTPSVLRWARVAGHFTPERAAEGVGVARDVLVSWESGDGQLTMAQLRGLARLYKRPLAVFYLPAPPSQEGAPPDFRSRSSDLDPSLALALRRARAIADALNEIGSPSTSRVPTVSGDSAGVDLDADRLRQALNVSVAEQESWKSAQRALLEWRRRIEGLGVIVMQSRFDPRVTAGFSLSRSTRPVIAVCAYDTHAARCFTLMHELTHVALGPSGAMCSPIDAGGQTASPDNVEAYCNAVAARVLMPTTAVRAAMKSDDASSNTIAARVTRLMKLFQVSEPAALIRLFEHGTISRSELSSAYARIAVRVVAPAPKPDGFAPPAEVAAATLGRTAVRGILDALGRGTLTEGAASDLLDLSSKHFDALRAIAVR